MVEVCDSISRDAANNQSRRQCTTVE